MKPTTEEEKKDTTIMNVTKKLVSLCAVVGLFAAQADFIATYDFNSNTSAVVTGDDASAVDAGSFSHPGSAAYSSYSGTMYLKANSTGADEAAALADTDYYTVTFTAADSPLNLSGMTFDFGGYANGSKLTTNVVVLAGVNGGALTQLNVTPSSYEVTGHDTLFTNATVDISAAAFDSVNTVVFEIRNFDDTDDSNRINRIDNFVISGAAATTVPEPAAFGMILAALGILSFVRRR